MTLAASNFIKGLKTLLGENSVNNCPGSPASAHEIPLGSGSSRECRGGERS